VRAAPPLDRLCYRDVRRELSVEMRVQLLEERIAGVKSTLLARRNIDPPGTPTAGSSGIRARPTTPTPVGSAKVCKRSQAACRALPPEWRMLKDHQRLGRTATTYVGEIVAGVVMLTRPPQRNPVIVPDGLRGGLA